MPFKSEKQRRFLWAEHPDIAKRWAHEYPTQEKLPLYAHKKENDENNNKESGKEAHMIDPKALLKPILARFAPSRGTPAMKISSILGPSNEPENALTQSTQTQLSGQAGTGNFPANLSNILCSKIAKSQKQAEVEKLAGILRKKAMVPAYNIRVFMKNIMDGVAQGMAQRQGGNHELGTGAGGPGSSNGNGLGSGLGNGTQGVAQGIVQNVQGNAPQSQGMNQNAQGMNQRGGALGPAPPKSSFLPKLVGDAYSQYLQSARNQISQSRMNAVIPPPMGSQAPAVVASYPGMNSAPQKTANMASTPALKPLQPISAQFQASNLANKNKNMFSTGNAGIFTTIGRNSPFKTEDGKVDVTAGVGAGAYGNLPNTPKAQSLG